MKTDIVIGMKQCSCCEGTGVVPVAAPSRKKEAAVAVTAAATASDGGTKTLRLGLVNEGKMSNAYSLFLSHWVIESKVDICLVSEAAHLGRCEPTSLPDLQWALPLEQRKAGAGMLMRREVLGDSKVKLVQDKELSWSSAIWRSSCGTLFVTCYLVPGETRRSGLESLLAHLNTTVDSEQRCVIGGDFNLPIGDRCRRLFDEWARGSGLVTVNPDTVTHRQTPASSGSNIDLLLVRGVAARAVWIDSGGSGHHRQIFEVEVPAGDWWPVAAQKLAWRRLQDPVAEKRFQDGVTKGLASGFSVQEAILRCAPKALGYAESARRNQLPAQVRAEVRKLRRRAKAFPAGSAERLAVVRELGALLRHHRAKDWKKKVRRLAAEHDVTEETWRLVSSLRRPTVTARAVGISDAEVASVYADVYGSNKMHRPDWLDPRSSSSAERTRCAPTSHQLDGPFSLDEIRAALRSLPRHKAPGLDGVPHEAYLSLLNNDTAVRALAKQASKALSTASAKRVDGRLVVIPKKGPPTGPLDMRPLMMLATERKFIEKLVVNRLHSLADREGWDGLHELQGGFRRGMNIERQLALAAIAIHSAKLTRTPLHLVALDIVKAFDTVPKAFAVHCATQLVGKSCPRLSRLIASLATAEMTAHVGSSHFRVATGVPQGSLLSPWLFVATMNDLALRIGSEGFRLPSGQVVGTLLYADDTLLLDPSMEESQQRCRLAQAWVEEWGGRIHPGKTGWVSINAAVAPHPLRPEDEAQDSGERPFEYLGMKVSSRGIEPMVPVSELVSSLGRIKSLSRADGLSPAAILQIVRSVSWPKVALGFPIALPDVTEYAREWHRVARRVLTTFDTLHGVEVQRELGLLFHPVHWACRAVIKFYGTALRSEHDRLLSDAISQNLVPGHPMRMAIEELLMPSGVTWSELCTVHTNDLLRKAAARIREWTRREVITEARRLGIYDGTAAAWAEMGDCPSGYLHEENARYGFCFRSRHFGPSNEATANCYFCGAIEGDCGAHLLVCSSARSVVPLPTTLLNLTDHTLMQALRLSRSAPTKLVQAALTHMGELWNKRRILRQRHPTPTVRKQYVHNVNFMRPRHPPVADSTPPTNPAHPTEPAPRTRATRRRAPADRTESDTRPPAPKRPRASPPQATTLTNNAAHNGAQPQRRNPPRARRRTGSPATSLPILLPATTSERVNSASPPTTAIATSAEPATRTRSPRRTRISPTPSFPTTASATVSNTPNPHEAPTPPASECSSASSPTQLIRTQSSSSSSAERSPAHPHDHDLATPPVPDWTPNSIPGREARKRTLESTPSVSLNVPSKRARLPLWLAVPAPRQVTPRTTPTRTTAAQTTAAEQTTPTTEQTTATTEQATATEPTHIPELTADTTPPPPQQLRPRSGNWTDSEDTLLLEAIACVGTSATDALAVWVGTRSKSQCAGRITTKVFQRKLASNAPAEFTAEATAVTPAPPPAATPARARNRRWTLDEDALLREAVRTFGSRTGELLSAAVPGRTAAQCKGRLRARAFAALTSATSDSSDPDSDASFRRDADAFRARCAQRRALNSGTAPSASTPTPATPADNASAPPTVPPPATAARPGRWTPAEDDKLCQAVIRECSTRDHQALAAAVGTRTALQCSDRLRAKVIKERLTAAGFTNSDQPYRWTPAELARLEAGINEVGDVGRPMEIAAIVRTRTAFQVAEKIRLLVNLGQLHRASENDVPSFSILQ